MGHSSRPRVVPENWHFHGRSGPAIPFTRSKVIFLIYTVTGVVVPLGVGIWLIVRGFRGGPAFPSCGKCGYDVTGTIGSATRCPECGTQFAEAGIIKPRGKQRPLMTIGGLVLIVAAVGCLGTSMSMFGAMGTRQARARATMMSAQAAAQAATTKPVADDAPSSESVEDPQPDQEP